MTYETDNFEVDVLERSHAIPVLVDFWAAWCSPCRVLGPVLEKLAEQSRGEWALAKLETERFPAIAAQYGIRSIPNVKLFVDGQVSDEFVGALPEPEVVEWLRKALPSKYRAQIEEAKRLLLEDKPGEAREILNRVIAAESDNDQAVVLLAWSVLDSDPQQAVKTARPIALGSEQSEAAEAIRTLATLFMQVDDPDSLPRESVKDTYVGAITGARSNNYEAALEGFIEVIRKNRYFADDGSRKACIAVFKLLGEDHKVTKKYRPAFSNALY
jgi:putative thioredoxin